MNPKIDELLKKAAATDDLGERRKLYQEIERIIIKDLPGFYLFSSASIWVLNKKVQDFGHIDEGVSI